MPGERNIRVGEMLGEGHEKVVYVHPDNTSKAVGVYRENQEEMPSRVKARFYLTKILHILYPENIPDIHLSATEPNVIVVDRILSEEGRLKNKIRKLNNLTEEETPTQTEVDLINKLQKSRQALSDKVASDPRMPFFIKEVEKLGIGIDDNLLNFLHDDQGNLKYLDSFLHADIKLNPEMDENALLEAINKVKNESERKKALNYFDRLIKLAEVA